MFDNKVYGSVQTVLSQRITEILYFTEDTQQSVRCICKKYSLCARTAPVSATVLYILLLY